MRLNLIVDVMHELQLETTMKMEFNVDNRAQELIECIKIELEKRGETSSALDLYNDSNQKIDPNHKLKQYVQSQPAHFIAYL